MATKPIVTLRGQLEAALKAAPWITPADSGAVALALLLADEITNRDDGSPLPRLAAELRALLKDLGLSVAGRTDPAETQMQGTPLDALRARQRIINTTNRKPPTKKAT